MFELVNAVLVGLGISDSSIHTFKSGREDMVSVDVKRNAAKDNVNAGVKVVWTSPIRRAARIRVVRARVTR